MQRQRRRIINHASVRRTWLLAPLILQWAPALVAPVQSPGQVHVGRGASSGHTRHCAPAHGRRTETHQRATQSPPALAAPGQAACRIEWSSSGPTGSRAGPCAGRVVARQGWPKNGFRPSPASRGAVGPRNANVHGVELPAHRGGARDAPGGRGAEPRACAPSTACRGGRRLGERLQAHGACAGPAACTRLHLPALSPSRPRSET